MPDIAPNDRPLDPSMLSQLWDFDDPAGSEQRFRNEIERHDASSIAAMELRTQVARALGLQERFNEADATLDGISSTDTRVLARVSLERGRLRNSSDNPVQAMQHFARALGHATMGHHSDLAVDAIHMLAIVDEDNAQIWVQQGLDIIAVADDPHTQRWRAALHNNLGWTLHDRGDYAVALEQFELALAAYEAQGTDRQVRIARWAVARCLRSLERYEEALAIQQALAEEDGSAPHVQEEIALLRKQLGTVERPDEGQQ
jgi:tetratricopeptide (TPR) repeat protein